MVTFNTSFRSFQGLAREFVAEFLGTFLLVFSGNNAVAESILTYGDGGNNVTIYFGYGFGLYLGLLVSANASGGHLNPAVTLAGAIFKRFKWSKVPHYLLAQYTGAFLGACATYLVYMDSFESYHTENGVNQTTASVFATYPKDDLSLLGSFMDQVLGSMILVLGIYAVSDPFNKVPEYLVPIYVSLTLVSIACSLGINQGFAINPARDFSPRFFTFISYWGSDVFGSGSYWYITLIGPHIGAVLGAGIYILGVERLRAIKDMTIATIETSSKKNNLCFTKCAFIDVGAALKEKKRREDIQKSKGTTGRKTLTFFNVNPSDIKVLRRMKVALICKSEWKIKTIWQRQDRFAEDSKKEKFQQLR